MNYVKTQTGELINQRYIVKFFFEGEKLYACLKNGDCCLIGVYNDTDKAMNHLAYELSCSGDVDMSISL